MICLLAHARCTYCGIFAEIGEPYSVWPKNAKPNNEICPECAKARSLALAVASLLIGVYYQISAAYRSVARLPEGKTGIQALQDAVRVSLYRDGNPHPDFLAEQMEWAARLGEKSATDQFLRVYAPKSLQLTLDRNVWAAYRELGGGTVR